MMNHSKPPKKCWGCKYSVLDGCDRMCEIGEENCIKETDEYKEVMKKVAMIMGSTNNDVFFKYSLSKNDKLYPAIFDIYFFRNLLLAVEDNRLNPNEAWKAYLDNGEDRRVIELIMKEEFDRL